MRFTPLLVAAIVVASTRTSTAAPAGPTTLPTPSGSEPLVVRVDDGSFRWEDAGIGAAAGFGAALVLTGGIALTGRQHRLAAPNRSEGDPS